MSSGTADRFFHAVAFASMFGGCVLAGCKPEPSTAPDAARPKPANWNLVDEGELIRPDAGVVVADRSGEYSYLMAAVNLLDGANATYWTAPPGDFEQWVVLELPSRARVSQVGVSTTEEGLGMAPPLKLMFEGSADGTTFSELRTFDVVKGRDRQLFDVPPTELRSLRVTMLRPPDSPTTPALATLHVRGVASEAATIPRFAGHWNVDGRSLDIAQDGKTIWAVAEMKPPMIFHGAVEGRVARLAWTRGNENGIAWLSVNGEGSRLSGMWWWFDPLMNPEFGEAWYGERVRDAAALDVPVRSLAQVHLRKVGRFPLYSLLFKPDGELDVEASRTGIEFIHEALKAFPKYRVRLEVLESNSWNPETNLGVASERARKLQTGLVAAGVPAARLVVEPRSRTDLNSPLYRLMYTHVDFSLAGD